MNKNNKGVKNALYYILVILAMVMVVYFLFGDNKSASPDIEYSTFTEQIQDGKIKNIKIQPAGGVYKITGEYKAKQEVANSGGLSIIGGGTESKTTHFSTIVLPNDSTLSQVNDLAKKIKLK